MINFAEKAVIRRKEGTSMVTDSYRGYAIRASCTWDAARGKWQTRAYAQRPGNDEHRATPIPLECDAESTGLAKGLAQARRWVDRLEDLGHAS